MTKSFSILLVAAILLQSLLGGVAAAGTICLGGGHEHPEDDVATSCALECSHAAEGMPLPTAVAENHSDCGCVDIDLSITELLTTLPRFETHAAPDALLLPVVTYSFSLVDHGLNPCPSFVPMWFDPGIARRNLDLSTTRLIV